MNDFLCEFDPSSQVDFVILLGESIQPPKYKDKYKDKDKYKYKDKDNDKDKHT